MLAYEISFTPANVSLQTKKKKQKKKTKQNKNKNKKQNKTRQKEAKLINKGRYMGNFTLNSLPPHFSL